MTVNGILRRDPEWWVEPDRDRLDVAGRTLQPEAKVYLMLNKPRGLVTTAADEQGRPTVFDCLKPPSRGPTTPAPAGLEPGQARPHLFAVGRLDKASEGLLLLTNDTAWAARITDPASRLDKTYHVQVDGLADEPLLERIRRGVNLEGERLAVKQARLLRSGGKNCWLELVLDEGKNRHLRRLLSALGLNVLRLLRIAIGPLVLGPLPKGQVRPLTPAEIQALASAARRA